MADALTFSNLYFRDENGPTLICMQSDQVLGVHFDLSVTIDGEPVPGVWATGIPVEPKENKHEP